MAEWIAVGGVGDDDYRFSDRKALRRELDPAFLPEKEIGTRAWALFGERLPDKEPEHGLFWERVA